MDYTPPPDLQGQYEFVVKAKSHFFWRGVWGDFAPTFSRADLSHLETQAEPRGEECMRQLKENGVCVFNGLKAKNGDVVTVMMDRGCAISRREGLINGSATFPVPADIGKLLPPPEKKAAAALDCSKPGIVHVPAPKVSASVVMPLTVSQVWHESAGRRVVLAPALPVNRKPGLV